MVKPLMKSKRTLSLAVLVLASFSTSHAGGFSLYGEGTGYVIGNYAAGVAAEALDASTGWYNPAGLALIHEQQLVVGGAGLFLGSNLSGISTYSSSIAGVYQQGFNGLDGAKNGFVPSLHYARPLNSDWTFGLSLVSPFGLRTDWSNTSAVRYQATNSELVTLTASPELGYRLNEHFALGAGLDLTYARVEFDSIVGIPPLALIFRRPATFFDSSSVNKGDSFGVGFHLGAMWMFNDNHSRIGLNFQSAERQRFRGNSRLTGRLASKAPAPPDLNAPADATFETRNLNSDPINLPYIVTLSAYHDYNEKLALLGSVVYTGWNSFSTIQLNNVAGFIPDEAGQVPITIRSPENWKNVWRFALGANYRINEALMLRVGGGYDQTPTNDERRSVRIPDTSRYALAIGARYAVRNNLDLDIGYAHLFQTHTVQINRTDILAPGTTFNVNATGRVQADLLGVQITWYFDGKELPAVMK